MTAAARSVPAVSPLRALALGYAAFIALGLVAGLLGVAWESIRAEYQLPIGAVGVLLFATTAGYLTASVLGGWMLRRLGYGTLILLGGVLTAAGLAGYAVLPAWALTAAAALIVGIGTGILDAGLNNYVAAFHGARAMNWLHACFGIGVTISPLILTFIIGATTSWRLGYGVIAGLVGVLVVALIVWRGEWRADQPALRDGASGPGRGAWLSSLRRPLVWISIVLFFTYAGLEATPGQWTFSLFTDSRGIPDATAGLLVSLYWGSFTIGRIFFGAIIPRFKETENVIRGCMAGAVAGALLVWWGPSPAVSYIGLIVLGFAQAPIFPILISNTARYVGADHAPNAIGFQVAGAGLGIAMLPALAGALAGATTIEIVMPLVVVAGLVMFGLHELLVRRSAG